MLTELIASLRAGDDRPAVLARTTVTRGDLARLTGGYAAALHARGLAAGDTVGLAVRPGARSLAVLLAAYRQGLRVAVLDPTAGPEVLLARLGLAAPRLVLADACLAALGLREPAWPGGAYNVADTAAYRRDEVIARVLGVPVRHVPVRPIRALATVTERAARPTRPAVLTRYAVDQRTDGLVLDLTKARARGWRPDPARRPF